MPSGPRLLRSDLPEGTDRYRAINISFGIYTTELSPLVLLNICRINIVIHHLKHSNQSRSDQTTHEDTPVQIGCFL